jgi:hypothetical protein
LFSRSSPDTAVIADVPLQRHVRGVAGTVVACTLVFGVTACLRFLALVGFTNDQYVTLAGAQQMLFGEWPTRDFLDFGAPLSYATSAAAQLIFGRNLFAEAMLVAVAFALAAALTVVVARRLSGSLIVAIVAALVEVAIFPRGYAYPKVLLYAAAPLVMWWYQDHPSSLLRMAVVALFVQIAFLFRHDHGLFIGTGAVVAAALGDGRPEPTRDMARRAVVFSLFLVAAALPYLVYVSLNGGVVRYLANGIAYSAAEAADNDLTVPPFGMTLDLEHNSEAFLFYLFYLLPIIAGLVIWTMRGSGRRSVAARLMPLVVIALMVDRGFLRDYLETRLADAIVPAVLLFSWLFGQTSRITSSSRFAVARTGVLVTALISVAAVTKVGATVEQLNRASLFGGIRRLPERFVDRSEELHARYNVHQMPAGPVLRLRPFFDYVDRCTTPDQRLLLPGFIPEVAVYAQRPFAGGRTTIVPGYIDTAAEQQRLLAQVARQNVPFVVVTGKFKDPVWRSFAELGAYVDRHYRRLVTYGTDGDRVVEVYVSETMPSSSIDPGTGWPCFR